MENPKKLENNDHVFNKNSQGSHLDDPEQFIRNAFQNNTEAGFELLFRRYYKVLCNHTLRFVWSKEIASDIVTEVFISLWKSGKINEIEKSYGTYLFKAVRNRSYNYLNREFNKTVPLDETTNPSIDSQSPEKIILFDELQFRLEKAIDSLPTQCKKVFMLNRLDGRKNNDIAQELNISAKTVEMHLTRALKHLKSALSSYLLTTILCCFMLT